MSGHLLNVQWSYESRDLRASASPADIRYPKAPPHGRAFVVLMDVMRRTALREARVSTALTRVLALPLRPLYCLRSVLHRASGAPAAAQRPQMPG